MKNLSHLWHFDGEKEPRPCYKQLTESWAKMAFSSKTLLEYIFRFEHLAKELCEAQAHASATILEFRGSFCGVGSERGKYARLATELFKNNPAMIQESPSKLFAAHFNYPLWRNISTSHSRILAGMCLHYSVLLELCLLVFGRNGTFHLCLFLLTQNP